MKIFLIISAVFPWLFCVGMLFAPAQLFAPIGIEVTPAIAQMAGAQGATMFGLGLINFMARNLTGRAIVPVLAGNLAVQLVNLFVLARAVMGGAMTQPNIMSMAIHIIFGAVFAYFLLREMKRPA